MSYKMNIIALSILASAPGGMEFVAIILGLAVELVRELRGRRIQSAIKRLSDGSEKPRIVKRKNEQSPENGAYKKP